MHAPQLGVNNLGHHRPLTLVNLRQTDEVLDTLLDQEDLEVDPIDRLEADTPLHKAVRFVNGLSKADWDAGGSLVELLLDAGADPRSVTIHHDAPETGGCAVANDAASSDTTPTNRGTPKQQNTQQSQAKTDGAGRSPEHRAPGRSPERRVRHDGGQRRRGRGQRRRRRPDRKRERQRLNEQERGSWLWLRTLLGVRRVSIAGGPERSCCIVEGRCEHLWYL